MKKICIFAIMSAATYGVSAEALNGNFELSREAATAFALNNNIELKAVRMGIDAAQGRTSQTGKMANPEFEAEFGNDMLFKNEGEYGMKFAISQKFPLFNRLTKEKNLAEIDIKLAENEFLNVSRLLAQDVELAYIEIAQKHAEIKIKEDMLSASKRFKETLSESAKRALISPLDVKRAENECIKIELEIMQAKADLETSISSFKILLGLKDTAKIKITDALAELNVIPQKITQETFESRPDWRMYDLARESAQAQIALEKAGRYEDIGIGIFYEHAKADDEPIGKKHERAMGISISIPLPLNTRDGSISEKLAMRKQAELRMIAAENKIRNEIKIYQNQAQQYAKILKAHRLQLGKTSDKIYAEYQKAHTEGKANVSEVFDAWQTTLEIKLAEIKLVSEQAQAAIKYKYSLGFRR